MHHYDFHIGDYMRATAHLSPMEDLAYRRLLDMYYDTEAPIPLDTDWVSRRLRLGSDVVLVVLQDFFIRTQEGWKSARCDAEIARYRDMAERARTNGKLGGRPKKTQSVPSRYPVETGSKANQEPVTSNQEPSLALTKEVVLVMTRGGVADPETGEIPDDPFPVLRVAK